MNITHICLGGPFTDGLNYQDNLLTKYQKLNGHKVCIIASKWIWNNDGNMELSDKVDYLNEDGVRVIRLPMLIFESYKNRFQIFKGLYRAIEATNPDILFIHGVGCISNFTIVRFLKNHHDVIAYGDNHADLTNTGTNWLSKNILHKGFGRFFANFLCPYVKKFYGVLPVRVDFLHEIYGLPKDKCDLLVLGADDEMVAHAKTTENNIYIRNKYNINLDDFLIVTGGKIDGFKYQTLLLMEAVRNIKNDKLKLIVFGSVVDNLKNRIINLSDGVKIQYIGWINPNETYNYFGAADLVVFPGRHSVFWEAVAAQGIPMLCKDLPGTHHVDVGGNVQFIKEDSVEEIENLLKNILNDKKQYNNMKYVAQTKAMKIFSYREIAKRAIEE